ncbi:MAG: hypothetical protein JWR69_3377, partial [Pedosphaera sp.]|nr:hypothetical protein [Pedosphaera sp.]
MQVRHLAPHAGRIRALPRSADFQVGLGLVRE